MPKFGYYQEEHKNNNLFSFIQKHIWERPYQDCLRWANPKAIQEFKGELNPELKHDKIDYQSFGRLAGKLANNLSSQGITEGSLVAVNLPFSLYYYLTLFSLLKINAISVFFDQWQDQESLDRLTRYLSLRGFIASDPVFHSTKDILGLKRIENKIGLGSQEFTSLESLCRGKNVADTLMAEQEQAAFLTYTWDKDKKIKALKRSHRLLAAQYYTLKKALPLQEGPMLSLFPVYSFHAFMAGHPLVLPAKPYHLAKKEDMPLLASQILSNRIETLVLPPLTLAELTRYCEQHKTTFPSVKNILTGGAPLAKETVVKILKLAPESFFWILYGIPEAEPISFIEGRDYLESPLKSSDNGLFVGQLYPSVTHKIITPKDEVVEIKDILDWMEIEKGPGEKGELIVAGEHIVRDYYNDSELQSRYKIKDDFGITWHRTGQMAKVTQDEKVWLY